MEKKLKKYLRNGTFGKVAEKTSKTMSAIKGKNNKSTELRLKMALVRNKISGFELHAKRYPGNPDIFFEAKKLAIYVDGCFWHGCPKCGHIPKTRTEFWQAKINRNKERDKVNRKKMQELGIKTITVWEHELKKGHDLNTVVEKIKKKLGE